MNKENIVLILMCISLAFIFPLLYLHTSLYVDESLFLVIGRKISYGAVLYRDVGDNKTPGIFLLSAFLFKVFGRSYIIPRLFVYTINSLSALMIFLLGKKIRNAEVGIHSSLLFLVVLYLPQYKAYTFITEPFAIFFFIIAAFLLSKKDAILYKFGAGISIGIGYLFNQTIMLFLIVIGIFYIAIYKKNLFHSLKNLFIVCLGMIIPILITSLYFIKLGAFKEFVECTISSIIPCFTLGRQSSLSVLGLANVINLHFSLNNLLISRIISFLSNPVLLFSIIAIIYILHRAISNQEKIEDRILLLIVWFIAFLFPGFRGLKSYHHMIFVLPPAAILSSLILFDKATINKIKKIINPKKLTCLFVFIIVISYISLNTIADSNIEVIDYQKSIATEIYGEIGKNATVYTFPFNNSIIFFSNLSVMNGWLGTPYTEELAYKVIESIDSQNITIIIVDSQAAQNVSSSYKIVYDFILTHYIPSKRVGNYIIFMRGEK